MFGIGPGELMILLILGLIIFGPNKLPDLARTLGRTVREFKKATEWSDEDDQKTAAKVKSEESS